MDGVPSDSEDTVARRSRRRTDTDTFRTVVELLDAWDPEFKSYTVASERMQVYLDRALNPEPIDAATHDVKTPHEVDTADIVIDDDIGINVYRQFREQEFHELRALISDCQQDRLIVWAYQLPIDDSSRDQWEFARSRYTGGGGSLSDIRFVHHIPEEDEAGTVELLLEYPEAMLFAFLSLVVGVALIVGTLGDGRSIVGGPVVTGMTSLVLVVLLILLWGVNR